MNLIRNLCAAASHCSACALAGCSTPRRTRVLEPAARRRSTRPTTVAAGRTRRRSRARLPASRAGAAPAARAVRRPPRPHPRRLRAARRAALRGRPRDRVVPQPARLPRPHVPARLALPVLHRHRDREARHAARTRAAAGRRERVQPGRLFAQPRRRACGSSSRARASTTASSRTGGSTSGATCIDATDAALTYLQYLNHVFQRRLVPRDRGLQRRRRHGQPRPCGATASAGCPTDFFSLDLRAETRDYVPKLLAISRIVRNPEAYGLQFAAIPNQPYFDVVDPGRQVHLGEAADLAGISRDDMFALNPAYNRMTTPPKGPHRLLLPIAERRAVPPGAARTRPCRRSAGARRGGRAAAGRPPPRAARRDAERDRAPVRRADGGAARRERPARLDHPPGRVAADSGGRRRAPRWPRSPRRARTSPASCPSTSRRVGCDAEAARAHGEARRHAVGRRAQATA